MGALALDLTNLTASLNGLLELDDGSLLASLRPLSDDDLAALSGAAAHQIREGTSAMSAAGGKRADALLARADGLNELRSAIEAERSARNLIAAGAPSTAAGVGPSGGGSVVPSGGQPRQGKPKPEPRITPMSVRRPAPPSPPKPAWGATIVASGSDRELVSRSSVVEELDDAWQRLRAMPGTGRKAVITIKAEGNPERRLGADVSENMARIDAVVGPEALAASGGICFPLPMRYEFPWITSSERPIKSSLPTFHASRGGVKIEPPIRMVDVDEGVSVWSHTNDVTPGSDGAATKPYATLDCPEVSTVYVEAIPARFRAGEFMRRFEPERWQGAIDALMAEHARRAELQLINRMVLGSLNVSAGENLSATRDLLAALDRAAAAMRDRQRLTTNAVLSVVIPRWVRDLIRVDLAREMPGATAERLAVADAHIGQWLAARNLSVTWSIDWQALTSAQDGLSALRPWPDIVRVLMYVPGSWLFLDGGILDLGIYRDSTLVATNDVEWFMETFERAAFIGNPNESLAIDIDLAPTGTAAALSSITSLYTTGS
jgi:hypothetical protein